MAECSAAVPSSGQRSRPSRPPTPSGLRNESTATDYKTLQKLHDKAYKAINKGLSQDEQGQKEEAMENYHQGLAILAEAMAVDAESVSDKDDEKDSAKQMQQKMTKTKMQIEYRLQSLQAHIMAGMTNGHHANGQVTSSSAPGMFDSPPSYQESVSGSMATDESYLSIGDSIMSDSSQSSVDSMTANATEILCFPEEVQIFYITPEGFVSAPSYPSALQIFKFTDEATSAEVGGAQRPPAFLKVHDWYYPLIPGTSPALRATNGAYIFPDMMSQREGSAVGLLLPNTLTAEERQHFEETLGTLTMLKEQESTPVTPSAPLSELAGEAVPRYSQEGAMMYPHGEIEAMRYPQENPKVEKEKTKEKEEEREGEATTTSAKISKGISVAAEWISWGVGKGAEKAGELIRQGSAKVREKLKPEENVKPIDPRIQAGARYARKGAHVAVKVSSYVVSKLGEATVAIAREVAPHIRKQGEKLLPKSVTQSSEDGKSKIDGVLEVAASGIKGASTVFLSLESAAKALGKNIANETVQTVQHKYGEDAGYLTENTLYTVGNVAMTAYNANHLGVKAIAKRAAKETGKEVLRDYVEKTKQQQPPPRPPPPN